VRARECRGQGGALVRSAALRGLQAPCGQVIAQLRRLRALALRAFLPSFSQRMVSGWWRRAE